MRVDDSSKDKQRQRQVTGGERQLAARAMHKRGVAVADIASRLNVAVDTVRRWVAKG